MALSFPNITLLGLNQESRFFDGGFQYSAFKRISIQGVLTDLTNAWGITGIWTGQDGIVSTVKTNRNYENLILNGISFGSGRIENIAFDAGFDVRTKNYQANLVIYDSGNLYNLTGFYYSGIEISQFQYLQNFSENYSFQQKINGGYSYNHDINIQFTSGVGDLNSITAAQNLAKTLFTGSNLGLQFYSGFTNKQGKRFYTESYNRIDNACVFQETFDFDANLGNYSAIKTQSVELGRDGITIATENGSIKGIENPNYQNALSAVQIELTGAYFRCSGVASNYFPSGAILINSPITQGRTMDIFNNDIGYSVVFTNNPNNSGSYTWDYTSEINRENGIGIINEEGSIVGRGVNRTTAFNAAQAGFLNIKGGIAGRVTTLFSSNFASPTNFLQSKSETFAPYQGRVNYNYEYSNDPTLVANAGIRRINITSDENDSIYSYNKVAIFNNKEITQDNKQSTQGSTSVTIEMQGDRGTALSTFLSQAVTTINNNLPVGDDRYIEDSVYSYSPNINTVTARVTWLYNKTAIKSINP